MHPRFRAGVFDKALKDVESAFRLAQTTSSAIELASYYASFATANFADTYDGADLEEFFLQKFGDRFVTATAHPCPTQKDAIHLISSSYLTGGHTRLMERLASMHSMPPDLVITERSNVDYGAAESHVLFDEIHDFSALSVDDRLRQLVVLLSSYRRIILHIHPQDFVSAIAVRIATAHGSSTSYFVNHADHLFSFGRRASDVILQVSAFGELLGRTRCPGLKSSFIGIPLKADWNDIQFSIPHDQSILTAGSGWKYRPIAGLSLPAMLSGLLRLAPEVKVVALGLNIWKDWWWWALKFSFPARVRLAGAMPFDEYIQHLKKHSFVMDSFPVTGGTAFPEAIAKGCIAVGMRGPMVGYTPADALRIGDVWELAQILADPDIYVERLKLTVPLLKEVHGLERVRSRYLAALDGVYEANPLVPVFSGDEFFFEKNSAGKMEVFSRRSGWSDVAMNVQAMICARYFCHLSLKSKFKYALNVAGSAANVLSRRYLIFCSALRGGRLNRDGHDQP